MVGRPGWVPKALWCALLVALASDAAGQPLDAGASLDAVERADATLPGSSASVPADADADSAPDVLTPLALAPAQPQRLRAPGREDRLTRREPHRETPPTTITVTRRAPEGSVRVPRRTFDEPWISPLVEWLAKDRALFGRLMEPRPSLFTRVLREIRPISAGLVFALVFLLGTVLLRFLLRHEPAAARLRTPANILIAYLGLFVLVILARLAWPEVYQVLYFVSLFVLVLGAIQALVVGVVDVFLGRYRRVEMPVILRDIGMIVIYVVTLILVLGKAGVNLTSILTTSAVLTAIIGFALQETLSSIISGLAIQVEKPFEVGEFIQFREQTGQVVEINWRTTKILTAHRDVVVIPNNVLTREPLINFSAPTPTHRRKVKLGLPYDVAPNTAKESILAGIRDVPGVLHDPCPQVLIVEYLDYRIIYRVYFFIDAFREREPIEDQVLSRIWYQLRRDGIRIPFPVQDINVFSAAPDSARDVERGEVGRRRAALDDVPFLAPLSEHERDELARRARTCGYAHGEVIIRQGDQGDSFYVVAEGEVQVRVASAAQDHVVATLGAGQFFGEMSLMTGESRTATVVATRDTRLHVIDRGAFLSIIAANEELIAAIGKVLAERRASLDARSSRQRDADASRLLADEQDTIIKKIRQFFRL